MHLLQRRGEEIKKPSIDYSDWGHPEIQLDDPVQSFKDSLATVTDLIVEGKPSDKKLRWDDEGSLPFGLSK